MIIKLTGSNHKTTKNSKLVVWFLPCTTTLYNKTIKSLWYVDTRRQEELSHEKMPFVLVYLPYHKLKSFLKVIIISEFNAVDFQKCIIIIIILNLYSTYYKKRT